ncbi:hypothetical protein B0B48_09945, partial [Lactobacillus gasseri]|uniref:hypothetical protein n=1 Tax=Lactobacillus gasseri TaxID=1596 RepID=UPI0009C426BF
TNMRVCNTQSRWDNINRSQPSKVEKKITVKKKKGRDRRTCGWVTSFLRKEKDDGESESTKEKKLRKPSGSRRRNFG